MVPQGEPSGEEAQVTWQALEERLNRTEEGRDLLACFKDDPSGARDALVRWLNSHRVNLFPQFSTNISGMVDKLVQIAQARTVVINPPSSVFDDLKDVLQNKHRHPNQSDLERGAYYRRDAEHDKIHALLAQERFCLIVGKPGHGKTAIARAIGYELLKKPQQTVFYLSAKTQASCQLWLQHIKSADFPYITYIVDDCHDAIDSVNEFIARWYGVKHARLLLLSRPIDSVLAGPSEENFLEILSDVRVRVEVDEKTIEGIITRLLLRQGAEGRDPGPLDKVLVCLITSFARNSEQL